MSASTRWIGLLGLIAFGICGCQWINGRPVDSATALVRTAEPQPVSSLDLVPLRQATSTSAGGNRPAAAARSSGGSPAAAAQPRRSLVTAAPDIRAVGRDESPAPRVQAVAFQQPADSPTQGLDHPPADSQELDDERLAPPARAEQSEANLIPEVLNLTQVEQLVLDQHPAILRQQAEIEALRGKLLQAGLAPNPTAGLQAEDINEDGGAGRYGVFYGREVVRGGKLQRARQVVCAEIEVAQQRLENARRHALRQARTDYYSLLIAQHKQLAVRELAGLFAESQRRIEQLFAAQEINRIALQMSTLETKSFEVKARQVEHELQAARRQLAGLLNLPADQLGAVQGDPRQLVELAEFEQSLDELLAANPELAALAADVERARRELARQRALAVPNVSWEASLGFDTVTDDLVTGFEIGMPLPICDCNQGAIYQARQEITAAVFEAENKALDLTQRMARAYQRYQRARVVVTAYELETLPETQAMLQLIKRQFEEGAIELDSSGDLLQMIDAQRSYLDATLTYYSALEELWLAATEVQSLLASDSVPITQLN